jgi:hypothetical protein
MREKCPICGKEFWGLTKYQLGKKIKSHIKDKHGKELKEVGVEL